MGSFVTGYEAGQEGAVTTEPIDVLIQEALGGPARRPAGARPLPILHPDHGRWWNAGVGRQGDDLVLSIERPGGDPGLINQCILSRDERRWSHQAGNALATARGVDAATYSVRFPGDFDGPLLASLEGSFAVAWSAIYGADTWVHLNNTTFLTVYKGTLKVVRATAG